MPPDAPVSPQCARGARTGLVGSLVAIWWVADGLVLLAVVLLAAWLNAHLVFVVALVVLTLLNAACCRWVEQSRDVFGGSGFGRRMEQRLTKLRSGRVMRHPVAWISGGSDVWYGLAAALTNALTTVAIARLVSGEPVGRRRRLVAAGSFSLFVAALGAVVGVAMRDLLLAL